MDIEKTIDHNKFDWFSTTDLRGIPDQWERKQLDFVDNKNLVQEYKDLIQLFSDALEQLISCYTRYLEGNTNDYPNRINQVKGLFESQEPYLSNWLSKEAVTDNDHQKYLNWIAKDFKLTFTHIGIDLTETGITEAIDRSLGISQTLTPKEKRKNEKPDILAMCYILLKHSRGQRIPVSPNGTKFSKQQIQDELKGMISEFEIAYVSMPRTIYNHVIGLDINNKKLLDGINANWPNEVIRILNKDLDVISFCNKKYGLNLK